MPRRARRTVEVGTLLYRANYFLANDQGPAAEREMMCGFIEGVLRDTGNYCGFRYLESTDYPDEVVYFYSRRHYYVSSKIQADYDAAKEQFEKQGNLT